MTAQTPNTSTSGTVGTPSPLPVATESLDAANAVTPVSTDHVQQISLVNVLAWLRWVLGSLAQSLSLAADPGTGRVRVVVEQINFPAVQTSNLNVAATAANAVVTVGSVSTTAGGGNKPDTLIFDAMQNAWANSVYPCIARS